MKPVIPYVMICGMLLAGCVKKEETAPAPGTVPAAAPAAAPADPGSPTPAAAATGETPPLSTSTSNSTFDLVPVPVESGVAKLLPENTNILFVCNHVGKPNPDPRTGGFEKFEGKAEVDAAAKTLKSVTVDIDTTSLWTEFGKLTSHLNSPDFFDTREHPTAKFESTEIKSEGSAGEAMVTGKLTLMGNTKEITFPATITVSDAGLVMKANFMIDRTEFGMTKMTEGVDKKVSLTVAIGEKTAPKKGG